MSSALKIARRYKGINSIGLHFERTHISVVVKAGCNENAYASKEWQLEICH